MHRFSGKTERMWLLPVIALSFLAAATVHADEDVFLVRIPVDFSEDSQFNDELSSGSLQKKAIPFSGGMYGKRSLVPFSGGMYGKRSQEGFFAQRRAVLPFSGGMYGKRSAPPLNDDDDARGSKRAVRPFSGGIYGKRSTGLRFVRSMPFSGGIYGR
ncbi:unnamed protein product [Caenorhabditis auriculariae]|uniref:Uncharacterized protein n=1 Tax=Caenorhabditis auriculariae TaxID=2777116 RepID=A0A8S1GXA8_9PELO|nr:unnamed protein product [Caenorhabditis auriculariae]